MNMTLRVLVTALVIAAIPVQARAQSYKEWNNICGSERGTFISCFSVQAQLFGTDLHLRVRNQAGEFGSAPDGVMTLIRLWNLPTRADAFGNPIGYNYTLESQAGPGNGITPAFAWYETNPYPGNADFRLPDYGQPASGIVSSCGLNSYPDVGLWVTPVAGCPNGDVINPDLNGGWVEMIFRDAVADAPSWDLSRAVMFATFRRSDGGGNYEWDRCGDYGSCARFTPSATTTPEPVSMALLGTGLFGVGAVRKRKMRKSGREGN